MSTRWGGNINEVAKKTECQCQKGTGVDKMAILTSCWPESNSSVLLLKEEEAVRMPAKEAFDALENQAKSATLSEPY